MNPTSGRRGAFTLVELLVVMAVIGILAALLLPALSRGMRQANRTACLSNLRQIGLAFQQFADEQRNRYPMQVSATGDGAAEATAAASERVAFFALAPENFQAVERELSTPKLLVCRADRRTAAADFASLRAEHVSYLLATNAVPGAADSVLAVDRNLVEQPEGTTGAGTNVALVFDQRQHQWRGNVLLGDGRVEWLRGLSFVPVRVPAENPRPSGPDRNPTDPPGRPGQPDPGGTPAGSPLPTGTTLTPRASGPVGVASSPVLEPAEPGGDTGPGTPESAPPAIDTPVISFLPVQPGPEAGGARWWWWLLLLLVVAGWLYARARRNTEDAEEALPRRVPAGVTMTNPVAVRGTLAQAGGVKRFFTGAAVNADLLVTMLEKHGIAARQEFAHAQARDTEDEFSRETIVFVPEADYDRAYQLFYGEREDEL